MAAGASFLHGPAHFSRPQPPFDGSSPAGEPPFRGLALGSCPPTGGRRWTVSVDTGIGGSVGAVVVALPRARGRWRRSHLSHAAASSVDGSSDGTEGRAPGGGKKGGGSFQSSSYAVPLGRAASSGITRPLGEILRDLNKRVPPKLVDPDDRSIPWYHANRLLSFYAPGWCGEVRKVVFSGDGSVTVVYRLTIRGSDGEAHRESSGTVSCSFVQGKDPVAAAEDVAFCRACARFGLGLYLYHDEGKI